MKFDIILFDADGTLFDFEKAEQRSFEKTVRSFHLPFSEELYKDYHLINDMLWKEFEKGLISKPDLLTERFRRYTKKYNIQIAAEEMNRFYLASLGSCSYLLDGAEEVCRHLSADKRLYLVTNGETSVQKNRFESSDIRRYFKDIFVSETAGYPKPHTEYFNYVFSRINNFDRSRSVIIGDSLSGDILGGNNAGIRTVWYNPGSASNQTGAVCDYTIGSLYELYELL